MGFATRTDTTDRGGHGTATPGAGSGARRKARRPVFDKEQATLFLLTITLGLGLGAVIRVVQRSQQASAAVSQLGTQSSSLPAVGYGSTYGSPYQRTYVLPQSSFNARGTTRMS